MNADNRQVVEVKLGELLQSIGQAAPSDPFAASLSMQDALSYTGLMPDEEKQKLVSLYRSLNGLTMDALLSLGEKYRSGAQLTDCEANRIEILKKICTVN